MGHSVGLLYMYLPSAVTMKENKIKNIMLLSLVNIDCAMNNLRVMHFARLLTQKLTNHQPLDLLVFALSATSFCDQSNHNSEIYGLMVYVLWYILYSHYGASRLCEAASRQGVRGSLRSLKSEAKVINYHF